MDSRLRDRYSDHRLFLGLRISEPGDSGHDFRFICGDHFADSERCDTLVAKTSHGPAYQAALEIESGVVGDVRISVIDVVFRDLVYSAESV